MKKSLIALIALVLIAVGTVFLLKNSLGDIVKLSISELGPKMTKAEVHVASVNISASDGQGVISGLQIGNPSGFNSMYALKADNIALAVVPASLLEPVVVLKHITFDSPHIIYEKSDQGSNFDVLQRNITQYVGQGKQADQNAKKMIIRYLLIQNAKVNYNETLNIPLPDIELHNIGEKTGGATGAEISKAVIKELSVQIVLALPKAAARGIGDAIKGLFGQ